MVIRCAKRSRTCTSSEKTTEKMKKGRGKDRTIMNLEQPETSSNMMTIPVKLEEDVEFVSCSARNLNAGNKSKRHLSKAEKEARRLRRVLANRESARQTIRRRQAMFDELTRKAVDLAGENDNLKKDKELAMKVYESLKSTNDCLKAQMANMMEAEAEIEENSESSNSEISTSVPTTTATFPFNLASIMPLHCPMMAQPSDASVEQCRLESGIATPLVPMMQLWKPASFLDQGNSVMIANPGTLLCALPFPCFFPFHAPGSAGQPQSSELNDKLNEISDGHPFNTSFSSKHIANTELSSPLKVKTEVLNSAGSTSAEDPHQAGFGFSPDGGEGKGICHHEMVLMPAPLNCIRPIASVGPFPALHQDDTPNIGPIASAGEHTTESSSYENQEATAQPSKNLTDAIAAAEARKRRKIKLKNLH